MSMLDFDIPYALTFALAAWIEVIAFLILMSIVTWQLLIVVIPAILITLRLQVPSAHRVPVSIFFQEKDLTNFVTLLFFLFFWQKRAIIYPLPGS